LISTTIPRERILATFSDLSPKQRRLARFFLDHEDEVAFASANYIGAQVGASPATVVRFCRALGYEGFTDLQTAIRAQFPQYRTAVQKFSEQIANGGFSDDLPLRIAQIGSQNIQTTLIQLSGADLTGAVSAIIQAEQTHIFGSGLSVAAAALTEYSLTTLGFPAQAHLNGGVRQTLEVSQITERDLVIVIAIWRYMRHEVDAVKATQSAGSTCIAITDSLVSPLADLADYTFVAATAGAAHSRSLVGILSLIELITATLAAKRPEKSIASLKRIDTLYRESGMLWSE
jgi:DNA-binding MurR/RpiR family transcriptional regulator